MTIAVRALVEPFRSVKREKELDREILAFSMSWIRRLVRSLRLDIAAPAGRSGQGTQAFR
jgi:hypothetical protein